MDIKLKEKIIELFKNDSRFWDVEKEELNQTLLKDAVDKFDEKVVGTLLADTEAKKQFFVKIKDAYIFKPNDFKFFLDENKLDNSYTQLANKIGLAAEETSNEKVFLNWPFKDCVLEGGMTKEDAMDVYFKYDAKTGEWKEEKAKRKEIFFNEVLARDEIDRLEESKAFYKWKRFTEKNSQKGEDVKEIKRDKNGNIKENFVIKGNNLLALHSLKDQFEGKVKLIYIDPPYNTETDSFTYNDNFKHSTWLTFMRNRLKIAKPLLSDDGLIFVQCDDNEQAYLRILMDELFDGKLVNCITVKMSELSGKKMAHGKNRLPKLKEYILVYKKNKVLLNKIKIKKDEWDGEYNIYLSNFKKEDKLFIDSVVSKQCKGEDDINAIDKILEKIEIESVDGELKRLKITNEIDKLNWKIENSYRIIRTAASSSVKTLADKKKLKNKNLLFSVLSSRDSILYIVKSDYLSSSVSPRVQVLFAEDYLDSGIGDLWSDINTTGLEAEGGVQLKSGKKPEKLLKRIIELSTRKGDIVLDYHAGSGTTCAVAHKMGRQWIGVEQLDYSENNPEERMKGVIAGDKTGISKEVNWQGGGDFIYVQLAKWNEEAKEKIRETKTYDDLVKLFGSLYEKYFLNYNVKAKDFKENVIKSEEFKKLSLSEQKKMVARMLDLNQMYVNFSERKDKKYNLSGEDIALSEEFYDKK